jgi:hypothetical protein
VCQRYGGFLLRELQMKYELRTKNHEVEAFPITENTIHDKTLWPQWMMDGTLKEGGDIGSVYYLSSEDRGVSLVVVDRDGFGRVVTPGCWVVRHSDGSLTIMRHHQFNITYIKQEDHEKSEFVKHFEELMSVAVLIGNTDNKLTQAEWSKLCQDVRDVLAELSAVKHFSGGSDWDAPWQTGCFVVAMNRCNFEKLPERLLPLVNMYRQDSIAVFGGAVNLVHSDRKEQAIARFQELLSRSS